MAGTALAVIPARYGSQRFPGKPLALIDGVPMIVRVLRNVQQAALVERVVVATDDERIATVVRRDGGDVMMTPTDLASGSDRVWAVARRLDCEIIVNVQGDEPLLPGSVVDSMITTLMGKAEFDLVTPVVQVPRASVVSADEVTVARSDDGAALYFSRSVIPWGADPVWRHIGVYGYRRRALEIFVAGVPAGVERAERLEQLRALSLGLRVCAVPVDFVSVAVDRPGDVVAVERLLRP